MSLIEKARAATETAAQRAQALKDHASGVASTVADRASSLGEQTTGLASDLKDRASALSSELADAALDRVKALVTELNAALPILGRAGYAINEVDLELGVPPKVVAVFAFAEAVTDEHIEQLLAENADAKLATMLVRALVRAHKLQMAIAIGGLHSKGIALEIGLTPSVTVKFGR